MQRVLAEQLSLPSAVRRGVRQHRHWPIILSSASLEDAIAYGLVLVFLSVVSYRAGLGTGLLAWLTFSLTVLLVDVDLDRVIRSPLPLGTTTAESDMAWPTAVLGRGETELICAELAPPPKRVLTLGSAGTAKTVPVFSVRNDAHHCEIAQRLVAGQTAVADIGPFVMMLCVPSEHTGSRAADKFWTVKPGRPATSKIIAVMEPRDALGIVDFDLVHPAFRHLQQRESFESLWEGLRAPLHVICPLRQPLPFFPRAFQTTTDELVEQATQNPQLSDRIVPFTTAGFWYFADPAWMRLMNTVRRSTRRGLFFGGSSFNVHTEDPPFTWDEFLEHLRRKDRLDFDMVITDPLMEACRGFSSHTQVRLPSPQEPAALIMLRQGHVSPEWLSEATGYSIRSLPSTSIASRHLGMTDGELREGLERLSAWARS